MPSALRPAKTARQSEPPVLYGMGMHDAYQAYRLEGEGGGGRRRSVTTAGPELYQHAYSILPSSSHSVYQDLRMQAVILILWINRVQGDLDRLFGERQQVWWRRSKREGVAPAAVKDA